MADALLHSWAPSAAQKRIVHLAGRAYGLFSPITGKGKGRLTVLARYAAAWALKARWPKLSYSAIAICLGRSDHSTVVSALRRAKELRATDMAFYALTETLAAGLEPVMPSPVVRAPRFKQPAIVLTAEERREAQDELVGEAHFGGIAMGSLRLLAALQRQHPERFQRKAA